MSANVFGTFFRVATFGESHGLALGAVVDGCPAGVHFDQALLNRALARRRPGQNAVVSDRSEADEVEVLSGVYQEKTLGTPIAMMVRNRDARSEDYAQLLPRPGHADDMWRGKFSYVDPRGGGRSSGRETVARVMAGAVAQMLLQQVISGIRICGFAEQIGPFELSPVERQQANAGFVNNSYFSEPFSARFPSDRHSEVERLLLDAKASGKSFGGSARIWIDGAPAGLGQPVFHKLKADLAAAMMGVGAVTGLEFGAGFASTEAEGSEFHQPQHKPNYGGIRGGISTGERIDLAVAFKPTASVLDVAKKGRHDPCIVPRAIPVLEAMAWLVLADHWLWRRNDQVD